jgi:protein involved in polysaccharide export with SLBB domain
MERVNRFLVVLVLGAVQLVHAQSLKSGLTQEATEDLKASAMGLGVSQPGGLALESTIDPESYFVGPSDGFAVNIWTSPPLSFTLTVTPEGTLIIPTVGEVRVSGLTLKAAKQLMTAEIKKKYAFPASTATLANPRPIVVYVTGQVLNPGSYTVGAYNRAYKAIQDANTSRSTVQERDVQRVLTTMSTRNIVVRHNDGTTNRVDIPKYLATKEDRWNPYLREGDVIVVPYGDQAKNVIGVYGQVNKPGRFEYVERDSIKDLVRMAYGLTPYALGDSVEFSRFAGDHSGITSTMINLHAILTGAQSDVALRPGDRLVVHSRVDQRADYFVTIAGEVKFPGVFPISKGSTRLSEVIARAGGFTEEAALKDAFISRHAVGNDQVELEHLESLRGGVPSEDTSYYYMETNLRLQKETVNADFEKLITSHDSSQDVIVLPGDLIAVPSIRKTVYVFGQIVNPGHVTYIPGQNLGSYIARAGGFTDRAREGDVKIVKARTRQWLSPKSTTIEEGDYIWVPKETEYPFSYYMNIIGQTASVVSVGVSIILLVIQTQK